MRNIKFRAWAKYGEMLDNVQNHIGNDSWAFGNILNSDDFIVMQFTGLKDKNGFEIYEGDIVKSLHFIGQDDTSHYLHFEVKWSKKFMGWVAIRSDGTEMQLWVCMNSTNGCLHVSGNIYENPELLQEKK